MVRVTPRDDALNFNGINVRAAGFFVLGHVGVVGIVMLLSLIRTRRAAAIGRLGVELDSPIRLNAEHRLDPAQ